MNRYLTLLLTCVSLTGWSQPSVENTSNLSMVRKIDHLPVKSQGKTGTCWSFSTTSLVESQLIHARVGDVDLSEMFVVRNIYLDKARNYVLRQGKAQFGSGGLGSDVVAGIARYGAVPESAYSGLLLGEKMHDHAALDDALKSYLDNLLENPPVKQNWLEEFNQILDDHLGKVPEQFTYREKVYNPKSFADEILKFRSGDYVYLTSFTHHPYYAPFIIEIPDNYRNESYYNLPLDELVAAVVSALEKGYSVMWDADVSNRNFKQKDIGFAMLWPNPDEVTNVVDPDADEMTVNQEIRQSLFESLTTQDDHLMHIVGLQRSKGGKNFFLVKNSWGEIGPFDGYINVSEPYFALNTITLVVPRAALNPALTAKLGLK